MAPKKSAKPDLQTEDRNDSDRRAHEAPRKDIWDIVPDADVDQRAIITDWASI